MPAQPLRRSPGWRKRILVALAGVAAVAAVVWSVSTALNQKERFEYDTSPPKPPDTYNPNSPPPSAIPTPVAGELTPVPAGLADVIYLPPDIAGDETATWGNDLPRQLVRQGLWLAAREDFGLHVRDAHVGDPAPVGLPADRHVRPGRFDTRLRYVGLVNWRFAVGPAVGGATIWEGGLADLDGSLAGTPARAVEVAERQSRDLLAKCLAAARFAPKPNRLSDAPVPAAAEEWLGQMREAAQFAALRLLHAEVRASGESPALLDGLARGYANLGMLTEHHWGQSSAVFQARSLLYAQRQLARSPKSAAAARTRAYAAALAGRHDLALSDLAAAAELAAADAAAPPPPAWVEVVDAFLHFDVKRLAAARAKGDTPLARVLHFLAAHDRDSSLATLALAQDLLADDPECYLIHDARCRLAGIGNLHAATVDGPEAFAAALPGRVGEQPGLPPAVARLVADGGATEARIYAALRAAGDPAVDRGEPSWAVLGATLQDARFVLAWHRLHFVAKKLAADAGPDYADAAAALDGHPLLPLLTACATDRRRDPAGYEAAVAAAPVGRLDLRASEYAEMVRPADPGSSGWYQTLIARNRTLYPYHVRAAAAWVRTVSPSTHVGTALATLSPHSPLAAAEHAFLKTADPVGRLAGLERAHPDSATVQRAVGDRHRLDSRPSDAARCYGRWVKLSSDALAYRALAGVYQAQGNDTLWMQTLEASLEAEDTGLEHAQVRVQLADHYMAKKDFARAEPYALKAAESFAGWALLCAAQCKVGLAEWDAANALYRANAERYDGEAFNWYFACRSAGRMDRAAAEAATQEYLTGLPSGVSPEQAFQAARFYLMTGRPADALPLFVRANAAPNTPSVLGGLLVALTADGLGDVVTRQAGVRATLESDHADDRGKLAAMCQAWLAGPGVPRADAIEDALRGLAAAAPADPQFLDGWLLANRGEAARAAGHWQRCVDAEAGTRSLKTHAKVFLEAHAAAGGDR